MKKYLFAAALLMLALIFAVPCSGGTATCEAQAVCATCGKPMAA